MAEKKKVYLVKYQAANGEMTGARFHDEQRAEEAAAALKRTEHKKVRLISKVVR